MEYLGRKVNIVKALWLKWRSLKQIPFRKKFFVGYDLDGNTYWEFYVEQKTDRMRRIVEYRTKRHVSEQDIPPQCIMWLRRTRPDFPSIQELAMDMQRQQNMKILAKEADRRWKEGSLLLNPGLTKEQQAQLAKVTGQLHHNTVKTEGKNAETHRDVVENPIETAQIQPRR